MRAVLATLAPPPSFALVVEFAVNVLFVMALPVFQVLTPPPNPAVLDWKVLPVTVRLPVVGPPLQ
jgi:hypothetical protein